MIGPPPNTRIWIAAGVTDMRSGFNSLAAKVQMMLEKDPFGGHVFIFRGRRGDLLKALYWSDGGLCLFAKRLEKGRFAWPRADADVVALTTAQLSLLLEGFGWRQPVEAARPRSAL
ncbi:MAG: IS66 family insertion sequence element accessory protein TnpB [Paraburkholderia sp.]|uniref:IS66 family insertion sequence element accessory protein TnpB n=1 Tax=Paraburkholderia sp. TaxID=1926495 RepID=UPI00397A5ABF